MRRCVDNVAIGVDEMSVFTEAVVVMSTDDTAINFLDCQKQY